MASTNQNTVTTNGVALPIAFPFELYEAIHARVLDQNGNHRYYEHFSGAWNAVVYRFRATADQSELFVKSITMHGTEPAPEERYRQEAILFDLFSSAFATFEAAFYGMYSIGSFTTPEAFPLSTEKEQQRVSPHTVKRVYESSFPDDPILTTLTNVFEDPGFQRIREIRNVLTHRTAPGRRMYVGLGEDETPATEWKLKDVPIDHSLAEQTTTDLADTLTRLLVGLSNFVN